MGCGCRKKKTNNTRDIIVNKKQCPITVSDIDSLRMLSISKGDFEDKENIMKVLREWRDNINKECPDIDNFNEVKLYIKNVK